MLYFRLFCMCVFVYFTEAFDKAENPITAVVRESLISTARSCMEKTNAVETDLEYLRNDPPYPEKAACIIKCLLEKIGIVKHNKYSKSGFMTAVSPLVFKNKKKLEHMKSVSENCEKEEMRENFGQQWDKIKKGGKRYEFLRTWQRDSYMHL